MAHSKKKKCSKKSRATDPQKELLGIRTLLSEAIGRLYRATVAWLRHLAVVLRQACARAGAAVATNAALIVNRNRVGHGVPPTRERVQPSDFISATDSAPRLTLSPASPPPPTGAKNSASTLPPPTGAKNRASTPPPPMGAKNRASGSQASGSASAPAPASKSGDSAPRPAPKPANSSPLTGAKNSGSQASGSAPGPASKACDSAPCLAPKPATLPLPTGAKNSTAGSQASSSTPAAGAKGSDSGPVPGAKKLRNSIGSAAQDSADVRDGFAQNRWLNQNDPFSDGYHLNSLFEEDECFVVDEYTLIYARFCSERATSLLNKREICHICYIKHGKVFPCKKEELKSHCKSVHHISGFLCEKQGCFIRTSSRGEAGRHHFFCHEKHHDWWVECLKLHGEM